MHTAVILQSLANQLPEATSDQIPLSRLYNPPGGERKAEAEGTGTYVGNVSAIYGVLRPDQLSARALASEKNNTTVCSAL